MLFNKKMADFCGFGRLRGQFLWACLVYENIFIKM